MDPLSPAGFHIPLADGERHGYGIMQEVAAQTRHKVIMGPGTSTALKRLLDAQLIEECGEHPDPLLNEERRRYYRMTLDGRRAAMAEAERLRAFSGRPVREVIVETSTS